MKSSKPSDLTERFVSGEEVFDGTFLKVRRDVVSLPDGSQGTREYIRHPGAVAIVPFLDDGRILLERQFRYPHGREFIEVPAGTAQEWTRLGVIHTAIAYTDEAIEIFLAKKLNHVGRKLDQGEFLETLILPFEEAIAMIGDGRITDAKTVAALLWVKQFR